MRLGGRRVLSVVAIYAIALHAVLWGAVAPQIASTALDPFSVICHSEAAGAPSEQTPSDHAPTHACDHCNLCSTSAPPAAPAIAAIIKLAPARLVQVLQPASVTIRTGIASRPQQARGPPNFA